MDFKDSEITDISEEDFKNNSGEIMELIYSTPHSLLYRMRKDGKYFIVKQNALLNETGRHILRREYEISLNLSHPNIVDIYQYRYSDGFDDRLIMEYVDGRNLNDFLSGTPSLKERKRIFIELTDAISYLHNNRIIHNDLKPGNIIISHTGNRVKLIDFGLSDDDANYALKSIGFTKGFSAPELINGSKSDSRSDIYSLGILMKLIFGKKYRGIVKKSTHKNPANRYPDIRTLRRSWEKHYLKWLIPVMILAIGFVAIGIWWIVDFQKNRLKNLEDTISLQSQALDKQIMVNEELSQSYTNVRDSLDIMINSLARHEELKSNKIEEFKRNLRALSFITLDSIKQCTYLSEEVRLKLNYQSKVKKLYDSSDKNIEGEDIEPLLHSIMMTEMENAFNEFNRQSPVRQTATFDTMKLPHLIQ